MGKKFALKRSDAKGRKTKKDRFNEYVDDIMRGIEKDRALCHITIDDDGNRTWSKESEIIAKRIIINALKAGSDPDAAFGIASVDKKQVAFWMKVDPVFKADVLYAKEYAIYSLIQICKSEPSTAWKLLKSVARGRFKDEVDKEALQGVQIVFNVPRPEEGLKVIDSYDTRVLPKAEDKIIDAEEVKEGEDADKDAPV